MTITNFTQTQGTIPTAPDAVSVAMEAAVTNDRAQAMIAASWALVETFTGRSYWPVTAAEGVASVPEGGADVCWPRAPFPEAVVVERRSAGAWALASGWSRC